MIKTTRTVCDASDGQRSPFAKTEVTTLDSPSRPHPPLSPDQPGPTLRLKELFMQARDVNVGYVPDLFLTNHEFPFGSSNAACADDLSEVVETAVNREEQTESSARRCARVLCPDTPSQGDSSRAERFDSEVASFGLQKIQKPGPSSTSSSRLPKTITQKGRRQRRHESAPASVFECSTSSPSTSDDFKATRRAASQIGSPGLSTPLMPMPLGKPSANKANEA